MVAAVHGKCVSRRMVDSHSMKWPYVPIGLRAFATSRKSWKGDGVLMMPRKVAANSTGNRVKE